MKKMYRKPCLKSMELLAAETLLSASPGGDQNNGGTTGGSETDGTTQNIWNSGEKSIW